MNWRSAERRILLVEDNPVNREVATRHAREVGASTVDVAANGLEASRRSPRQPTTWS